VNPRPLPPQLHGSQADWNGTLVPPNNDPLPGHGNKPSGLFWTSSERADGRSAWLDICCLPRIGLRPVSVHRFHVTGSPRILVLRNRQQLIDLAFEWRLLRHYGDDEEWRQYCDAFESESWDDYVDRRMDVLLDSNEFWGLARNSYDAVNIPEDAAFREKWMKQFEVESTFWYRPHLFLKHAGRIDEATTTMRPPSAIVT
jgi:hypothetical protein